MIQKMKYVIIEENGFKLPIIFSTCIGHNTFAHKNPISAGFIKIESLNSEIEIYGCIMNDIKVSCYGESDSLGITSKEEDSEIVREDILKGWRF